MKIYELAKKIGVKAGDLSKAAKDMGIEKAGNFTQLSDDQAQSLAKAVATTPATTTSSPAPAPSVPEPPPAPKPVHFHGIPIKPVSREEDRARLVGGRDRALASYRTRNQGRRPYTPMKPISARPVAAQAASAVAMPTNAQPPAPSSAPSSVSSSVSSPASAGAALSPEP